MIAQVLPFTFDREFVELAPASGTALEREHLREEAEHLRREIARAEERGRAEGEALALERFRSERETALLAATDALQASLECLEERFDQLETEMRQQGAALALAAADHLAGRALEQAPEAAIDQAIGRVLAELRRGAPLEVRVCPDLAPAIEARVEERQTRDRRKLRVMVIADATLQLGDARLLWERGGAALDRGARRAMLVEELERSLGA